MIIAFILLFLLVSIIFVYTACVIFNPKLRAKLISKQFKSLKHMVDYSKNDIEDLSKTVVGMQNSILNENKEELKNIADIQTDIEVDSIKRKTKAFRDGLMGDDSQTEFCKYCGELVDKDSVFCKVCGKKLK